MAVQQNKKSRSRSGMRRGSHAKIAAPTLSINPLTGLAHRRHHLAADGTYRGKQYLFTSTHDDTTEAS